MAFGGCRASSADPAHPNDSMMEMMKGRRNFPFLAALLLAFVIGVPRAFAQNSSSPDYRVGPRDLLDVTVEQDPSLNTVERVTPDGRLTISLLGPVYVNGLSPLEIEKKLETLLAQKYITNPKVTVVVREYESDALLVFGQVRNPGRIPATGNMTLLQAISAAGGLTENHGPMIHILRLASNGLSDQLEIDVSELIQKSDPDVNIPVQAADVINVPADPEISVSMLGEVMKQGVMKFKTSDNVTLLQALAAAGGLTDRASVRNIVIVRRSEKGEERLVFNLSRILAGKDDDPRLKANDTIYVRESFF